MKAKSQATSSSVRRLRRSEWAFHLIPAAEIPDAAYWELRRHQNIRTYLCPEPHDMARPWLDLPEQEKAALRGKLNVGVFTEFSLTEENCRYFVSRGEGGYVTWNVPFHVGLFGVDMAAKNSEIEAGFRQWLQMQRVAHGRPERHPNQPYWFPANRPPFKTWLLDIACWRASTKAGLDRKGVRKLLEPLRRADWFCGSDTGRFSSKHWKRCLRRAEALSNGILKSPRKPRRTKRAAV